MVTYSGSLVQLCYGEGGTLQTNITGMCGECSQFVDHPGFAPAHSSVLSRSTLLKLQGALQGTLESRPCVSCTSQVLAAQVLILRYSARAQTRLGVHFVPFAVLSSSGDQMLGECTVPGGRCFVLFFFKFYFYFILLYNTILVLPYIDMNPPRVYMRSQT